MIILRNLTIAGALLCSFALHGQITIGTLKEPVEAALLDLRTQETNDPNSITDVDNITSIKGGLGLPRVMLENRKTLEPMILITDPLWISANSKLREKHAGLMVYNINVSPESETDPDKIFRQGVYSWNGRRWLPAYQGKKFFPCPAFNLPLPWITRSTDDDFTYDLYAEYKKQFMQTGNSHFVSNNSGLENISPSNLNRLYKATELDYVVTHYDESTLQVTKIDAEGVMSYQVLNHDPEPDSFINIVFVIKE